jgi:hypothetical protein
MKAVIRHLPTDTQDEEICEGLVNLVFDVLSVTQMTTTRRSSSDVTATTRNPPPPLPHKLAQDGEITRDLPSA